MRWKSLDVVVVESGLYSGGYGTSLKVERWPLIGPQRIQLALSFILHFHICHM